MAEHGLLFYVQCDDKITIFWIKNLANILILTITLQNQLLNNFLGAKDPVWTIFVDQISRRKCASNEVKCRSREAALKTRRHLEKRWICAENGLDLFTTTIAVVRAERVKSALSSYC